MSENQHFEPVLLQFPKTLAFKALAVGNIKITQSAGRRQWMYLHRIQSLLPKVCLLFGIHD